MQHITSVVLVTYKSKNNITISLQIHYHKSNILLLPLTLEEVIAYITIVTAKSNALRLHITCELQFNILKLNNKSIRRRKCIRNACILLC